MKDKIYSQLLSRTEFGSHQFYSKSLYRSRAGNHFYGTKFEIRVDFGLAGNTEKKIGPYLGGLFFYVFMGYLMLQGTFFPLYTSKKDPTSDPRQSVILM